PVHLVRPAPPSAPLYTLSLHDALPIFIEAHLTLGERGLSAGDAASALRHATAAYQLARNEELVQGVLARLYHLMQRSGRSQADRSEEHTSELQSRENLVCRLLLEKKKQ